MEGGTDWYKWPVMYCFHSMPRTLKTSQNWPQSRSAIETYSECDKQWGVREGRGRGDGSRDGKAV